MSSSDSPLDPEILLATTLRFLSGGSYIDLIDIYQLPVKCSHLYFWKTLDVVSNASNNINLPTTSEEWIHLSTDWSTKMIINFKEDL